MSHPTRRANDPRPIPAPSPALPGTVVVDGARIRFGVRGRGPVDLVLLHGHGAHHVWWHAVVPLLEKDFRVILLDLSGHGDSDHRADYPSSIRVAELLAVLDAVASPRPIVAAHSMGGRVAVLAGAAHPSRIAGLALVDTTFRPPERHRPRRTPDAAGGRAYPTRAEALARFRLHPSQPSPPPEMVGPVAEYSVRHGVEGWVWKHDRRGLLGVDDATVHAAAARLTLPLAYLHAGRSAVVDDGMVEHLLATVAGPVRSALVPGASHHLPLDAPEETARFIAGSAQWIRSAR